MVSSGKSREYAFKNFYFWKNKGHPTVCTERRTKASVVRRTSSRLIKTLDNISLTKLK